MAQRKDREETTEHGASQPVSPHLGRRLLRVATLVAGMAGTILAPAVLAQEGTEPGYPHGEFDEDCSMCHSSEGWRPVTIGDEFDHGRSGFALEGAHASAMCRACHITLEFQRTSRECAACHQDVHGGELGPDCARCHTTRSFVDRADEVRSHRLTRFPLTGSHVVLDCDDCHRPFGGALRFVNTPTECELCHLQDFLGTVDPDHAAQGFDRDCVACHSTFAWSPADFDHDFTGFPLVGGHRGLVCEDCHAGGTSIAPSPECQSCHADDYQQAPGHVSGNFPLDCEQCHTPLGWSSADFPHDFFPLTGGHAGLSCLDCHTSGTVGSIPADCYSCHAADYQQAPDHQSLAFPLDCESCHTPTVWPNANFAHVFSLSGPHNQPCSDCHDNGTTQEFSCLGACHQHTQADMDDRHRSVGGYNYDFDLCLSCHPTGND